GEDDLALLSDITGRLAAAAERTRAFPGSSDAAQKTLEALRASLRSRREPSFGRRPPAVLAEILARHLGGGEKEARPLSALLGGKAGSGGEVIRAREERWDGSGHPHGLRGEAIPLGARILAVVDAFQRLTEGSPYRPALSPEQARAEVAREA